MTSAIETLGLFRKTTLVTFLGHFLGRSLHTLFPESVDSGEMGRNAVSRNDFRPLRDVFDVRLWIESEVTLDAANSNIARRAQESAHTTPATTTAAAVPMLVINNQNHRIVPAYGARPTRCCVLQMCLHQIQPSGTKRGYLRMSHADDRHHITFPRSSSLAGVRSIRPSGADLAVKMVPGGATRLPRVIRDRSSAMNSFLAMRPLWVNTSVLENRQRAPPKECPNGLNELRADSTVNDATVASCAIRQKTERYLEGA